MRLLFVALSGLATLIGLVAFMACIALPFLRPIAGADLTGNFFWALWAGVVAIAAFAFAGVLLRYATAWTSEAA